jgi:hypothetical protein
MNKEQAIEVLTQAIDQGFKQGVYSLQDAAFIVQSLAVLFPQSEEEVIESR